MLAYLPAAASQAAGELHHPRDRNGKVESAALSSHGLESSLDDYRRACSEAAAAVRAHLRRLAKDLQVGCCGAVSGGAVCASPHAAVSIADFVRRGFGSLGALHRRRCKRSWCAPPPWAWLRRRWTLTPARRCGGWERVLGERSHLSQLWIDGLNSALSGLVACCRRGWQLPTQEFAAAVEQGQGVQDAGQEEFVIENMW